jgi:HEAT repeat protein
MVIGMNIDDALRFLAEHQPLPADEDLSDDLIQEFDDVRTFFVSHADPRCARLLVGALGDGSGFGVYQLVEDALRNQERGAVVEALREGLSSERRGVRSWSAEIAAGGYHDASLIPGAMAVLLGNDSGDTRYWAAVLLSELAASGEVDRSAIAGLLETEQEAQVAEVLREAMTQF